MGCLDTRNKLVRTLNRLGCFESAMACEVRIVKLWFAADYIEHGENLDSGLKECESAISEVVLEEFEMRKERG